MTGDDLTEDELRAVITALKEKIDRDRHPLAPRLAPFKSALAKLDPSSAPKPRKAETAAAASRTHPGRRDAEVINPAGLSSERVVQHSGSVPSLYIAAFVRRPRMRANLILYLRD
jgi:hypothetical protein